MLNHIDRRLLPGGYLGVDVFFVISGFVITASLLRRPPCGFWRFLGDFYARRCRRLVPALAVCAVASGAAAWLVDPVPVYSLHAGLAALVGGANVYLLAISADYFTPSSALNLFTQTWSLGVEEQFYLLYPALVWICGVRRLFAVVLGLSALSLALLAAMPGHAGGAAYFLMFGRFWEIGLGCAAALRAGRGGGWRARPWLGWLALGALIGAMAAPVAENVLASALVVPPALLLILSGASGRGAARLLACAPCVAVGRVSYSLYLWHWPVVSLSLLAFGHYRWQVPIELAIMAALGTASYVLVERPARRMLADRPAAASYRMAAGALAGAAAVLLGFGVWTNPAPLAERSFAEIPPAFPRFPVTGAVVDRNCTVDDEARPLRADMVTRCTLPPAQAGRPTIWAMGDSHAGHLMGMLADLYDATGDGIHLIETPNNVFPAPPGVREPSRAALFAATLPRLRPGDVILLARLMLTRAGPIAPMPGLDAWLGEVSALAARVRPLGVRVVVAGPPPIYRFASIYACRPNPDGSTGCDIARPVLAAAIDPVMAALRATAAGQANLSVFDSFAALCPASARTCSPVSGLVPLYRDQDHLNAAGSARLAPAFRRFLDDLPPG